MSDIIIVKIGTESLHDFESSPKVNKLVESIINKTREGYRILLVTSGAVQFGRQTLNRTKDPHENKAMLAAVGWDSLMAAYRKKFHEIGQIHIAGFLITHADIEDYKTQREQFTNTVESTWEEGLIPIVNENDALSREELDAGKRGGDNDTNAYLLAVALNADQLILTTNTNGIYQDKNDQSSRITSILSADITPEYITEVCGSIVSQTGTGGMGSKLKVGKMAGDVGIPTHIGNGIDSGLHDMTSGGTNIIPKI